jgi:hypothetical protein
MREPFNPIVKIVVARGVVDSQNPVVKRKPRAAVVKPGYAFDAFISTSLPEDGDAEAIV